jgi:hypothetical protein
MAAPLSGAWSQLNANANQYVGALKWGTGTNPIHSQYGEGPPLRVTGREPGPEEAGFDSEGLPEALEAPEQYGYTIEDIQTIQTFPGRPPAVGTDRGGPRSDMDHYPSWGPMLPSSGTVFRTIAEGAQVNRHTPISYPTETVTEGWDNKLTGEVEDAGTSDPVQYERQTSMQQVNPAAGRNNDLAVQRGTDDARANIMTRLVGQKIKPWSTGERLADMFPFQQDTIVRPFWYRQIGTGDPAQMAPNEMYVSDPVQREPPPDPYLGPQETDQEVSDNTYGYSTEDAIY